MTLTNRLFPEVFWEMEFEGETEMFYLIHVLFTGGILHWPLSICIYGNTLH